jgi:16S rRNA (guanine966-N2)-methyltransferase
MIRIIGGRLRGRRLYVPPGRVVRPTAERLRQALFDMLAHAPWAAPGLGGARVADVFAGSGAFGLEALSRGAAEALFIEKHPAVLRVLARNVEALGLEAQVRLLRADACHPPPAPLPADLLFLDPPYGEGLAAPALTALAARGWLHRESLVIIEIGEEEAAPSLPLAWITERRHGAGRVLIGRPISGRCGFPALPGRSGAAGAP